MALLPDTLPVLTTLGQPVEGAHWVRVDPRSAEARTRSEADWNAIIQANTGAFAEALRAANVIGEDSTLLFLGREIGAVDLMFVEVPRGDEEDVDQGEQPLSALQPRRLVLVENKLLRNPKSRREVLAQLLEYAHVAQREWTTRFVCQGAEGPIGAWLLSHAGQLDVMLAHGDLLLVIAGDGISEDLLQLSRRFAASFDPLFVAELCLVSFALYRRGEERLLIPHVVSAVQRHSRQLSVRVTVKGEDGVALPARFERDEEEEVSYARRGSLPTNPDVTAFFERLKPLLDAHLPADRFVPRGGERKELAYWLDEEVRLKIHFGGFVRDAWSPIQVGLQVESETARQAWLSRAQQALESGELPVGTTVSTPGKKTVAALKTFPWTTPSELDDAMFDAVTKTMLEFARVFGS